MPVGIMIDVSAVVVGSLIGPIMGKVLSTRVMGELSKSFGFIAAMLAITSIIKVSNVGAVGLATVIRQYEVTSQG